MNRPDRRSPPACWPNPIAVESPSQCGTFYEIIVAKIASQAIHKRDKARRLRRAAHATSLQTTGVFNEARQPTTSASAALRSWRQTPL